MSNIIEAADLIKTYESGDVVVDALRGVSLAVGYGEIVVVMGPSGCGKSTLMHILGAMMKATSGTVLIEGRNIADMGDRARTEFRRDKVGFVFQKFNLLPTLPAKVNIELASRISGSDSVESKGHMREIFDLLQIQNKLDRRPAELSGGEQQRVAIARAVAKQPAIILADEPTGNLDSRNSEIVLNMFKALNRRLGQTIILVTHNPDLTRYADRVVEMLDGKIIRNGTLDQTGKPGHVPHVSPGEG